MRLSRALTLVLAALVVGVAGCGGNSSDGQVGGTTTRATTAPGSAAKRTPKDTTEPGDAKSPESGDGEKEKQPAKKAEKPAQHRNGGKQPKAVREATELAERLQRQASQPLTREDLERIAEEAQARAERLIDPPPGKTVADVLKEIQKEAAAGVP